MTGAPRPVISMVTPNYNGAAFLPEAIKSVLGQNYPALQYVLVDGASTDESLTVAEPYRGSLASLISEPDAGHADALNKGFALTDGEIMGWINSDDVLLPGCLQTVAEVFSAFPRVEWITGRPSTMNMRSELEFAGPVRPWSRLRFLSGDHLWIQQESTFWRRSLWNRAGGRINDEFQVANDFELWARFFQHAELYSVDRLLGCFRVRNGQRSVIHLPRYLKEAESVLQRELDQLEPAFRQAHRSLLPDRPLRLSPERLRAQEDMLAAQDPPVITSAALRSGRLDPEAVRESRLEYDPSDDDARSIESGWRETALRNWRFVAALALFAGLTAALVAALPGAQGWVLVAGLFGISVTFTGAVALKTRRIVRTLERDVRRSLGARARAELRNQRLESEIDALCRRLKDRD